MKEYEPLRQFVELARTLHFGRTATACHLSPSALSRSIQRLEAELGEPLFERQHHSVALTPSGEAFRRHALCVLEEWDRFQAERNAGLGQLSGTIHIYCTVTAAQSIMPDLLGRVRRDHPGIRIDLATGYASDAIDQLRRGSIDISIAALPDHLPTGIASRVLVTTPLVLVAPKATQAGLADALNSRPINWSRIPLVLPAHGLARDYVDEWLDHLAVSPSIYAEIEGHEAILSLVTLGCGIGVVPRLVLENSPLRPRMTEVSTRPRLRPFRIGLCVRERSLSNPLVGAVWEAQTSRTDLRHPRA